MIKFFKYLSNLSENKIDDFIDKNFVRIWNCIEDNPKVLKYVFSKINTDKLKYIKVY